MIITGNNLKSLIKQYDIVRPQAYDQFSILLTMDKNIVKFKETIPCITYGQDVTEDNYDKITLTDGYILEPKQAILACSNEIIKMPLGYIGFLQTKGSLARLFVTVHCCDGQVESGYNGKITFEICNMGTIPVKIYANSPIAQLFIFQSSSDIESYEGKYNQAMEPTISNHTYNKEK